VTGGAPAGGPLPATIPVVPVAVATGGPPASSPATQPAAITVTPVRPAADLASAVPLPLGQVVTARLDEKPDPSTRHFWLIDVPAGDYKLVWEARPTSNTWTNVGCTIDLLTPDGENLDRVLLVSDVGYRVRAVAPLAPKAAGRFILRVDNGARPCDYWLGVFPRNQPLPAPYFVDRPAVEPLSLDKPATVLLDGNSPKTYAAWYAVDVPAGDYKLAAEFSLPGAQASNVGGYVDVFDAEGVERQSGVIFLSEVEVSIKKSTKLSVPAGTRLILRVRANTRREYTTVTLTKWPTE
jgi:hypothetical protein